MMTADEFVKKAEAYQKLKTTYVWGTFGWPTTKAMVDRALAAYSSNGKYYSKLTAYTGGGYIMTDCVGLIKSILWGFTGDMSKPYCGAVYAGNGVPDIDADTMINRCNGVSRDFTGIVAGEAVWVKGHIGIYIGGGRVIECTPAWDDGVQMTALGNLGAVSSLHSRTWTKHGRLPYVDYSGKIRYVANTDCLNMRSAPGTDSKILTVLVDGQRLTWHGEQAMVDGVKWVPVKTDDGKEGWVCARYLRK